MGNKEGKHHHHNNGNNNNDQVSTNDNNNFSEGLDPFAQQRQEQQVFSGDQPRQPKSTRQPFFESLATADDGGISTSANLASKFIIPHEKGPDRWSSNYIRDEVQFTPTGAQISIGTKSSVKPFSGGELISRETGLDYGVYSCDMISTNNKGHVTAFFLIANGINEIDIELTGRVPTVCWVNVWKGKTQHPVKIELEFDASEGWHTYAIEWRKDFIAWYIDGRKVHQRSDVEVADPKTAEFKLAMNSWTHNQEDQWAGRFEMPTDGRAVVSQFRNMSYTP
ncbi:hypothetical protein BGZ81_001652 [Podila clonocystis]|nr:hypothetical protein BGZ81_001652 [Podila clonocystis]